VINKLPNFAGDCLPKPISKAAAAADPTPSALNKDDVKTIVGKSSETFNESLNESQVKRFKKLAGME